MDINELKQLNSSGFLRRVAVQTTLNKRAFKEHKVFVTFVAVTGNYTGEVTFMLQHTCLRSLVLTKQLLDNNSIPYAYTDLTPQQPAQLASCSPDSQVVAEPITSPSHCSICDKSDFTIAAGCLNSAVFSLRSGDWACNLVRASA